MSLPLLILHAVTRSRCRRGIQRRAFRWRVPPAVVLLLLILPGCGDRRMQEAVTITRGDPHRGRVTIKRAGCGACHTIPGIAGAHALVGPSLRGVASRNYIAGVLPNTPENLVRWLLDPRRHSPRTVMPVTGLTEADARDVAAYLYTLHD